MTIKSPPWVTVFRNPRENTEVTFPSEANRSNVKSRQVFGILDEIFKMKTLKAIELDPGSEKGYYI